MWSFSKKAYPPLADLALVDSWDLCEGIDSDQPLIVRINRGLAPAVRHPLFRHQVGVATPLRHPREDGLPSPAEQEELDALEDRLVGLLAIGHETLYAASITTGGMREFVFYTSEPEEVQERIERIAEETTDREIQGIIQNDPRWKVYRSLA